MNDDQNATVSAPWTHGEVRAVLRWQVDRYVHALTCPDHPEHPLALNNNRLRCLVGGCEYTQTWVPARIVKGAVNTTRLHQHEFHNGRCLLCGIS